ncbi:unnamed protein product, partial [Prorocentrum cordatum]
MTATTRSSTACACDSRMRWSTQKCYFAVRTGKRPLRAGCSAVPPPCRRATATWASSGARRPSGRRRRSSASSLESARPPTRRPPRRAAAELAWAPPSPAPSARRRWRGE